MDDAPFQPSGTLHYFRKAIEVIRLNRTAIRDVAVDHKVLTFGLLVAAVGGVLAAVAHSGLAGIVFLAFYSVVSLFLFSAFVHLLAGYSKGRQEFLGLVRVVALASLMDWLALAPVTALLVTLWGLVVAVVAVEVVYGLSRTKAAAAVLAAAAGIWIVTIVLFSGPLGALYQATG